jgi:hypothetical protein
LKNAKNLSGHPRHCPFGPPKHVFFHTCRTSKNAVHYAQSNSTFQTTEQFFLESLGGPQSPFYSPGAGMTPIEAHPPNRPTHKYAPNCTKSHTWHVVVLEKTCLVAPMSLWVDIGWVFLAFVLAARFFCMCKNTHCKVGVIFL